MRVLKVEPHLSERALKSIVNSQKSVRDFRDWQIIYSVQANPGKKASEIAEILCITKDKVYKTVEKYNRLGSSWKRGGHWGGRRESRCIMPRERERVFLQGVEGDALAGQIITYQQIKTKLEIQMDRKVSDDYIWDMFRRHGWTKKVPRPAHPKADEAAREEYKKNFRKIWQPNSWSLKTGKIPDR
ncbi:MAG: winged helix-turn-helix domain-containing protein [Tannerella sp.]|jgi:transposase|nr:winged helix-turn-helix domain-containing protein [Tannerella sp.]